MEQAMRQEFEDRFPIPEGIEWRDTDYFPVQTDNVHVYVALAGVAARYTSMWQAWQASRAALRVELPKPHPAFEYAPRTKVFNITDVEIALQQAGIEVK
ncbi:MULTISPECIES: hypothetical protein [Pseudomonas]|nr:MULTISPECIES: hypothetical protein [unclassified Pseudomonas]HBN9777828.1 hypothetical protein [Pseudomonas aeruginosa]HCF7106613.1 hypothetical protein [Pseudomonas aeruginosa]HEH9252921.1 hypothetical protein [Pseudomonas aeruginosa]